MKIVEKLAEFKRVHSAQSEAFVQARVLEGLM